MKKLVCLLLAALLAAGVIPSFAEELQYGYCNEDTRLYMGASQKALSEGVAAKGTRLVVNGEQPDETGGFTWYQVTLEDSGKTGYILADDVDLVIAKKALKPVSEAPRTGETVQVTNENAYPVLKASGQVDPLTLPGAMEAGKYSDIKAGDSGDAVKAVKTRLIALGFLTTAANNKYGKDMAKVIKQFQKANGLTEDGECTAALQAMLFSTAARDKTGAIYDAACPLKLSKGTVKANKNGGGTISFTLKNSGSDKIDAFNYILRLYNTYGERFTLRSLYDEITIRDELQAFESSEERDTIKKGQTMQMTMDMGRVYFAGCMIAITGYHTTDGATVRYADDQLSWYAFGKGVTAGYQEQLVTPLTDKENSLSEAWSLGADGRYVDGELAAAYDIREGLLVTAMEPGCPMDQTGVKAGDILLAVGDVRIFGGSSMKRAAAAISAGQTVTVLYWRNGNIYAAQLSREAGTAL